MRIKLDENMPRRIEALLEAAGHEVSTVHAEDLVGSPDHVVAQIAVHEGRMIVTLDRGFPAPTTLPPTHPGIVVLKLRDQSVPAVEKAVTQLMALYALDTLHNCICVVSQERIRVRRLK